MRRLYNRFSEALIHRLKKYGYIEAADIPSIQYTLYYLFQSLLYHTTLIIIGIIFGQLIFTMVYIIVMGCLKHFTGGAHAPNGFICSVLSYSIFLATMYLNNHLQTTSDVTIYVILSLNILITLMLAPVDCTNKRFNQEQRCRLKQKTKILIMMISIFLWLLLSHEEFFIVNVVLTCLSVNSLNLVIGYIINMKEIPNETEHSSL